jgi:predicted nuclease with TOPRIM domain
MQKTIAALKQQLEEKDAAIANLSAELEKRNFQIDELKDNVDQLNVQVAEQKEDIKAKEEEIEQKTDQMNEAYVFIGDKNALKNAGLIEGGSLLKKSKLNTSNIDKKLFKKVDIRDVKSIPIPDDKPEVMTQMPAGSYKITKTGDNSSELVITDPVRFWSVSRFLIIRY